MVRECKQQLFLAKDSVSGAKNRLLSPDPGNKSNTPSVYSWIFLCGSFCPYLLLLNATDGVGVFLSDPGIPGVRSMGPSVCPSVSDVWLT